MKALVLAGGYDQIALIKYLKEYGYEVILLDYLDNPPAKSEVKKHYQKSTLDIDEVKEVALLEKVDLITTACTDQALLTVAKVSEDLNLPCYITYQKALDVTNKLYMKKKFTENNIPTSKYIIVEDVKETENISLAYPIVVKPVDCNSSKGVKKVLNKEELENATKEAIKLSRTNNAIIEEYKEGFELVSGISSDDMVILYPDEIKNEGILVKF